MGLKKRNLNEQEAFTTKDGSQVRLLFDASDGTLENESLASATLAPGQSTIEHRHPESDEIYFILEGTGRMTVEGESEDVEPGDAVAIPHGHTHRLANTGDVALTFLCCCAPPYSHEDTVLEAGS
jgi:mannose-6-phosphate isomerase-like protein (cupin superfamily)